MIRGVVQGVGFRQYVREKAIALHLRGFVRNLDNGSVECVAEGDPDAISSLEKYLHKGPPFSQVRDLQRKESSLPLPENFEIRF